MKHTMETLRARCEINEDGCWLWRGDRYTNGNPRVKNDGQRVPVKRLTLQLAGKKGPSRYGCARCVEDGDCINPDHLQVFTRLQMVERFSARAPTSKLRILKSIVARRKVAQKGSIELAREIRSSSESNAELAIRHGYNISTVRAIRAGRMWREISGIGSL